MSRALPAYYSRAVALAVSKNIPVPMAEGRWSLAVANTEVTSQPSSVKSLYDRYTRADGVRKSHRADH
jgi:hypothetical protein